MKPSRLNQSFQVRFSRLSTDTSALYAPENFYLFLSVLFKLLGLTTEEAILQLRFILEDYTSMTLIADRRLGNLVSLRIWEHCSRYARVFGDETHTQWREKATTSVSDALQRLGRRTTSLRWPEDDEKMKETEEALFRRPVREEIEI